MKTKFYLKTPKLTISVKTKFLSKTVCLLCTLLLLCTFQNTWANPIDEEEYDYVFTICLGESIELEGEILWAPGPIWDGYGDPEDACDSNDWQDPRPIYWTPSELTSCSPCLFTTVTPTITTVFTCESSYSSIVDGCSDGYGAPDVIYDLDSESIETTYLIIVDSTCSILPPDPCETCTDQTFAPVCGSDGNTYYNTCEAECAGVEVIFNGACENIDHIYTICPGEEIDLFANPSEPIGPFYSGDEDDPCDDGSWYDLADFDWTPAQFVECPTCEITFVSPTVTTLFTSQMTFESISEEFCVMGAVGATNVTGSTYATGTYNGPTGAVGNTGTNHTDDYVEDVCGVGEYDDFYYYFNEDFDVSYDTLTFTFLVIVDQTCNNTLDPCETCTDQPYTPVCGVDGTTYYNTCQAECAGVEILAEGECMPQDPCETCTEQANEPVCGDDGNTYFNACEAECAGVEIIAEGECTLGTAPPDPCFSCIEYPYDPVCDEDGNTYYNLCEADCAGAYNTTSGTCMEYDYVLTICAGDSIALDGDHIYSPNCIYDCPFPVGPPGPLDVNWSPADLAGCNVCNYPVVSPTTTTVFTAYSSYSCESPCDGPSGASGQFTTTYLVIVVQGCNEPVFPNPCGICNEYGEDPVCGVDGNTYFNACEAECAGVEINYGGNCASPLDPCDTCTEQANEPVCGADGNTYFNACEAECAGVEILAEGECLPEPTSPCETCIQQAYAPVCDENGNTYYNTCEAECAGAFNTTSGTCINYDYVLTICAGDSITLEGEHIFTPNCSSPPGCDIPVGPPGPLDVNWSPADLAGCNVCDYPVVSPTTTTVFTAYSNYVCGSPCGGGAGGASIQYTTDYLVIVVQGCNEDYQPPVESCATCITEDYAPVCDGEGNTYYNLCEAECAAGVGVYYNGNCEDTNTTLNFTNYPWLNSIVNPEDACAYQSVTEYSNGSYSYIYIEASDDCEDANDVLYYDGVVFCENGYFDCFDLYDLDDFEATTLWTSSTAPVPCESNCTDDSEPVCGSDGNTYDNACLAECAGVEVVDCETINTMPNFEEFPWLDDIVDTQDCCNNATVIQYTNGAYSYIYLTGDDACEGTFDALYYNGSLFCESDYLDCFDFYGLEDFEAITLWSCNGGDEDNNDNDDDDDDNNNNDNDNEGNNNEPNFENFPWLNDIVDTDNCCDDALVTEYTNGAYSFIYVEANPDCSDVAPTLYYNGNMHCDGEDFDCFDLYDLADFTANILWSCDGAMGKVEGTNDNVLQQDKGLLATVNAKIFPNPTQDVLNVGTIGFNMENLHIQMMDYTGRIIQSIETTSPTLQIQTSDLQVGTYILFITDGEQSIVQKFVKVN